MKLISAISVHRKEVKCDRGGGGTAIYIYIYMDTDSRDHRRFPTLGT